MGKRERAERQAARASLSVFAAEATSVVADAIPAEATSVVADAIPAEATSVVAVAAATVNGPKRTYTVVYNGHRDGLKDGSRGFMLKTGIRGAGEVYFSQPRNVVASDMLPAQGSTVTLYATDTEMSGYTLYYGSTSAANGRHTYRPAGSAATVVIHAASMPTVLDGMQNPPAMLVCSLPIKVAPKATATASATASATATTETK